MACGDEPQVLRHRRWGEGGQHPLRGTGYGPASARCFCKGPLVNSFGFVEQTAFAETTQPGRAKAVSHGTLNGHGCVLIKLYFMNTEM